MSGTIALHKGDCIEVMETLNAGSVDMILTDLPYGTTANKWDAVIPFAPMWEQFLRVCKPSAAIVLTASQPFTSALVMSQPKLFRHEWVWKKPNGSNFLNVKREPMKEHEVALVFSRGKWTYNVQMQKRLPSSASKIGTTYRSGGTSENYGSHKQAIKVVTELRVPSSVQLFTRDRGLHPTQKPGDLMRYLIRTYSNAGETILDATMGSGTTGVAAVMEGRNFVGIERDDAYFDIACGRMSYTDHLIAV